MLYISYDSSIDTYSIIKAQLKISKKEMVFSFRFTNEFVLSKKTEGYIFVIHTNKCSGIF